MGNLQHPDPRVAYLMGRADAYRKASDATVGNGALANEFLALSRTARERAVEAASPSYAVGAPTCPGCGFLTEEHKGHYVCMIGDCDQYGSSVGEVTA